MKINITFLERCNQTLEKALHLLNQADPEKIEFDLYRSACIKEFEIILEQSGKMLRKALLPYFHSSKAVDQLIFKDVFRHAVLRNIVSAAAGERWLTYRDNRNSTAHEYGVNFAEETIGLLPQFIADTKDLITAIELQNNK